MNIQRMNSFQTGFTNPYPAQGQSHETNADFVSTLSSRASRLAAQVASPSAEKTDAFINPWQIPSASALKTAFQTWLTTASNRLGPEYQERLERHAPAFEQIMHKAESEGGYADPLAFIQKLSGQELNVLQNIHSLAQPIHPGSLTQEGALNLLLPKSQHKDIDKDGYVTVGAAKLWVFPHPDAPPEVQQAWQAALANQEESELVLQGYFLPPPGQSAYVGSSASDYLALISTRLSAARASQQLDFPWQHEHRRKQIAFLEDFLKLLE